MSSLNLSFISTAYSVYVEDSKLTKDADSIIATGNYESAQGNIFDGLNVLTGDTKFSKNSYYANGSTIMMLDQKTNQVIYVDAKTGNAEFKSVGDLAPSLKGQDIKFGSDELYKVSNPTEGLVTKPQDGKFGVSGQELFDIMQTAKTNNIPVKDAVKEFLIGKYGKDSTEVLEKLSGQQYNKECGQGFLKEYRDQAFDMLAGKLADKIKSVPEQAVDNNDIVVNNYQGFNFDCKKDLNDKEQLLMQESAKIDKDLFDKNTDGYSDKLVSYVQKLYPDYSSKIGKDSIVFGSKNDGNVDAEIDGKPISIVADFQNHANGQVQELSDVDNSALGKIMKEGKTDAEKKAAVYDYLYGQFGSDPNTVSQKDAGKERSRTWFTKSWAQQMANDIVTKYNSGNPVHNVGVPEKDGIGLKERSGIDATVKWDPMKVENGDSEITFVDDENNDGNFAGKSELMGYDKGWSDMLKFDKNGDGKISGAELDKVMVLKRDKSTGQTEFISARKAGLGAIDLKSHVDKNQVIDEDQTLIGSFNVKMADGREIEAQQTADSSSWLDKFVENIKKGLGIS